jgi:SPP1 gp7 family putative phage head morphogenesis protein
LSARTSTEAEQLAVALLCLDFTKRKHLRAIDRDRPVVAEARAFIHIVMLQFLQMLGTRLAMAARGLHVAHTAMHKAAADDHEITAAIEVADYEGLRHQVEPQIGKIAKDGARAGLGQVGADLDKMLSQVNARAVTWAGERSAELIASVSATTRDRVRGLVADAIREGWSNDQLADALLGDDAFSGARAEMVARTETAAADVQGNLIGWKESGLVEGKEWKVGAGCCDECEDLDGEQVGIGEEFPDGDPPLHPNCRCDVLPVLADDAE